MATKSQSTLDGVAINIWPDRVKAELRSPQNSRLPVFGEPIRHAVVPHPTSVRVHCENSSNVVRVIRLRVESDTDKWNPDWVRFRFAVRKATDPRGGAVQSHDQLSYDGKELRILLLYGEEREVWLEFHPVLDGRTEMGCYPYQLIVEDAEASNPALSRIVESGNLILDMPPGNYLQQLPGIYQEAMLEERRTSENSLIPPFFERFLRGFEDGVEPVQFLMGKLHLLFGPQSVPTELLNWLATWVALALDENWPELRRRRLISEAVALYARRGTRWALSRYIELYTGFVPIIDDQPIEGMKLGPACKLKDRENEKDKDKLLLGGMPAHCFRVTIAVPDGAVVNEQILKQIIMAEKPAHTAYDLRIVAKT